MVKTFTITMLDILSLVCDCQFKFSNPFLYEHTKGSYIVKLRPTNLKTQYYSGPYLERIAVIFCRSMLGSLRHINMFLLKVAINCRQMNR